MPADGDSSQPKLKISQWSMSIWRVAASTLGIPVAAVRTDDEARAFVSQPGFESQPLVNELLELEEEFGEAGHDALEEALRERGVDPRAWGDLNAPDMVARAFVELHDEVGRGESRVRDAIISARFRTPALVKRTTFEFCGERGRALLIDLVKMKGTLAITFFGEGFGTDVLAELLDGALYVGRGAKLRAPVVLEQGQRKALVHRPAVTDILRYDAATGKLQVTARSRRLARLYADALGEVHFGTKEYFGEEEKLTLAPLKRGVSVLQHAPDSVVECVTLVKFAGCEGTFSGGGSAMDLDRFVESYPEIELTEARLRIELKDRTRIAVTIRPDKGVIVDKREHEKLVDGYLTHVGIRAPSADALNLWTAHPWRLGEGEWRGLLGNELDLLVADGVVVPARLAAILNPAGPETLVVHEGDHGVLYGVGHDAEDSARALSASEIGGLQLLPDKLALRVAVGLRCELNVVDLDGGRVWRLGMCELADGHEVELVLVLGEPRAPLADIVRTTLGAAPFIALVPNGLSVGEVRAVNVKSWTDFRKTRVRIANVLNVRSLLPLQEQNPDGVSIRRSTGEMSVKDKVVQINLSAPLRLMLALADSYPNDFDTNALDEEISKQETPGEGLKQAKNQLKRLLRDAGIDIDDLLVAKQRGSLGLKLPTKVV
ncbi:MAG: hypothetical protein HYS27_22790 [Deltaproteobacteria bacterium]|nr:hypothetical protein [Deltaproteobacteria bacterium]